MKAHLLPIALVTLFSTLGISQSLGTTAVQAAVSHTTPVKMRGTWYGYCKEYSFWEKIHLTKYTYSYQSGSYKFKCRHIDNIHGLTYTVDGGRKYAYTFQQHKHVAATDSYSWGKAKVNGKYRKCLVQDGSIAMFRTKIKHYSSVK